MKSFFLFIALLSISFLIQAQQAAVANKTQNIAYSGVTNPLVCVVSNYPASAVEISTDNGIIKKAGDGFFEFIPKENGPTRLYVWVKLKTGMIKVDSVAFRVKNLPTPMAFIGPQQSGIISVEKLVLMGGVRAMLPPELGFDAPVRVISFEAKGFSIDSCLFKFSNMGSIWSEENKKQLQTLRYGDFILFYNISVQTPDKKVWEINEIFLKIG